AVCARRNAGDCSVPSSPSREPDRAGGSKNPSSKLQGPGKIQIPSTRRRILLNWLARVFGSWCLELPWILVLGSWIFPSAYLPSTHRNERHPLPFGVAV